MQQNPLACGSWVTRAGTRRRGEPQASRVCGIASRRRAITTSRNSFRPVGTKGVFSGEGLAEGGGISGHSPSYKL